MVLVEYVVILSARRQESFNPGIIFIKTKILQMDIALGVRHALIRTAGQQPRQKETEMGQAALEARVLTGPHICSKKYTVDKHDPMVIL
jgi:hypothetical protein